MSDTAFEFVEAGGARRALACRLSSPGERARFAAFARPALPEAAWREMSLAPFEPAVYDQADTNSCVGHGAAAAFGCAWAYAGRPPHRFSPGFLYAQINRDRDAGATVSDALEALRTAGVCLEETVPPGVLFRRDIPAAAYAEAKNHTIARAYALDTFAEAASALLLNFVVVFGVGIGRAFRPDPAGVVPDRVGTGGGHCLYATGLKRVGGRWHLRVVNSWGPTWGLGGVCFLPPSYFDGLVDAYAVQAAADDPDDPSVPPVAR